jgi:hypothetical protein
MGRGVPAVEQPRLGEEDGTRACARDRGARRVPLADPGDFFTEAAVERLAGRHCDLGDTDEVRRRRGGEIRLRHDRDAVRSAHGAGMTADDRRPHELGPRLPVHHEPPVAADGCEQVVEPEHDRRRRLRKRQHRDVDGPRAPVDGRFVRFHA